MTGLPDFDRREWMLIGLLAAALLLLGVVLLNLAFLQPRRRRRPLRDAIRLLTGSDADLERAEELLGRAVTAGLRARDLADARFALAYVRAMLGHGDPVRYQRAATTVAELIGARGRDAPTAYLELWLNAKLDNQNDVRSLYESHSGLLGDMLQTRLIVSIAYLRRAAEQWRNREIDGAVHHFELVRRLDELADHVPPHVRSLQIVHGIHAVFDGRIEDARRAFTSARDQARQAHETTAEADLGLVACEWKAGRPAQVDATLGEIVTALAARGQRSPRPAAGDGGPDSPDVTLLAAAALLHAVSLLLRWLAERPTGSGLGDADFAELAARVSRAREADSELGEAMLLLGLIRYYFADDDGRRREAIDLLDESTRTSRAVTLPEVRALIDLERRLVDERADVVTKFLAFLEEIYLGNEEIPVGLRRAVRDRLERFQRYNRLGDVDVPAGYLAPSVVDMGHRSGLLRERVLRLLEPSLRERLASHISALDTATNGLSTVVDDIYQAESAIVRRIGEVLIGEDDPLPGREHDQAEGGGP